MESNNSPLSASASSTFTPMSEPRSRDTEPDGHQTSKACPLSPVGAPGLHAPASSGSLVRSNRAPPHYAPVSMGLELVVALLASAASSGAVASAIRAFVRRDIEDVELAPIDDHDVDEALVALREELRSGGSATGGPSGEASPAPSPGELEAQAIMRVYAKELTTEAKRIAKRAKAERPSKDHVRQAADRGRPLGTSHHPLPCEESSRQAADLAVKVLPGLPCSRARHRIVHHPDVLTLKGGVCCTDRCRLGRAGAVLLPTRAMCTSALKAPW